MKSIIKNYLKKRFENLIFESPLFYSWSVGIRFEIGSKNIPLPKINFKNIGNNGFSSMPMN